jgi:dipeptidyl aminopeptidase/acylaminoacyl peptidase
MGDTPTWIRRFTATVIGFPAWSAETPDRLAIVSNRSGSWQAWAHDRSSGQWRQASEEPVGVESVYALPDGRIAWWRDDSGDERGAAVAQPFSGGGVERLFPDVPDGWSTGLSFAGRRAAFGIEADGLYRIFVADDGRPARQILEASRPAGVGRQWPDGAGGLSADGSLACIRHAAHADILHSALRAVDAGTGETVAEVVDPGRNLEPGAWSPVPGDQRLAFTSELGPFERPAIWDVATGERNDLSVDLPGAVFPVDWWPDGRRLLVRHEHEGRAQLYALDMELGGTELLADPRGDIGEARVRPDGDVWYATSDGVHPSRILSVRDGEVVRNPDEQAPGGRPLHSYWVDNPHGDRIQSFLVTPGGSGPFPTVMSIHGGPEWHERDRFDPETQAFVDAGYAVALVNYRGSTGYGTAFREALIGNVCFTESEDIIATLDRLVDDGIADPRRVYWAGWSWGGCLACFNAGVHPDRWRALFAGIPAGDFVAAHWAAAPELQAWDDAVYGGSPDEVPDAYRLSDPMTYADSVRAPTLIIAGQADPRCPVEGWRPWVDAVQGNGTEVQVHLYPTGHHANSMHEQVRHMQLILDFFERHH